MGLELNKKDLMVILNNRNYILSLENILIKNILNICKKNNIFKYEDLNNDNIKQINDIYQQYILLIQNYKKHLGLLFEEKENLDYLVPLIPNINNIFKKLNIKFDINMLYEDLNLEPFNLDLMISNINIKLDKIRIVEENKKIKELELEKLKNSKTNIPETKKQIINPIEEITELKTNKPSSIKELLLKSKETEKIKLINPNTEQKLKIPEFKEIDFKPIEVVDNKEEKSLKIDNEKQLINVINFFGTIDISEQKEESNKKVKIKDLINKK